MKQLDYSYSTYSYVNILFGNGEFSPYELVMLLL